MTTKSKPASRVEKRTARQATSSLTSKNAAVTARRPKSMLTIADVLDEIDVPKSTFYRWLNTGRGPRSFKLPNGKRKIRRADLDAWLSTFEQGVAQEGAPC
ncbi:helix-turn-helix transcriptional regulator [Streptosporangium sp. G11]|uniref:helix-turn-helix transcriptional regulator n=1 Tax=Streptosporangium sp. G11 TaxID=3436926 RepID=UPI003EB788BE